MTRPARRAPAAGRPRRDDGAGSRRRSAAGRRATRRAQLPAVPARLPRLRRAPGSSTATSSVLPTPAFFYGLEPGEEITRRDRAGQDADRQVPDGRRAAPGRHADRLLRAERPAARGHRPRPIARQSRSSPSAKADPAKPGQIGAPMPGRGLHRRRRSWTSRSRRAIACSSWKR